MILVTGATGFLGAELVIQLLKKNNLIRCIKRTNSAIPLKLQNYQTQIEWVDANILDLSDLDDAFTGITLVYHCAALVSFRSDLKSQMLSVNMEGTANIVNLCLANNINKLVHVSSVAALGRIREDGAVDETMHWTPETSNSVYGKSKYLAEMEVWRAMAEGLNIAIVNPVIIFGAGDWNKGSSEIFKSSYNQFPWYTNGISGFVDVLDVVDAMQLLMDSPIVGERYIISAENLSYQTVLLCNTL